MLQTHARLLEIFRNQNIKLVCVDADDTLWYDSRYFRRVENLLASLCEDVGIQPTELRQRLDQQRKNFSPGEHGFAMSVREFVKALEWNDDKIAVIEIELERFLSHGVELLVGAEETMRLLDLYRRVLLTKGKETEQQRKFLSSGLNQVFDQVVILNRKGAQELSDVLAQLGYTGEQTIIIGNSIQHDIIPAAANNASAIYLNHSENTHGRNGVLPTCAVEVHDWCQIEAAVIQSKHS